tara:strand:+ start:300 stop:575 length:276 start_codon:yes stop_codon:yes gene_type:complete
MKFEIEGKRTRVITTTIEEYVTGEIDITKKNVMIATDCSAKEDGDTTAWYGYVSEALYNGAPHKDADVEVLILTEIKTETVEFDSHPDTDY